MLSMGQFGERILQFLLQGGTTALELVLFEMSETLIVASVCRKILFGKSAQTCFRLRSAWGSQIERNSTSNFCKINW